MFLISEKSRTDLGTTETLSQWVAGALSQRVKRPGYEPTTRLHTVPIELYIRSTYAIAARCLIKHGERFIFVLLFQITLS